MSANSKDTQRTPSEPAPPTEAGPDETTGPTTAEPTTDPATTSPDAGGGAEAVTDGQGTVDSLVGEDPEKPRELPVVNLQLKYLRQVEQRTFKAEFSSQKAVVRTYRPQGFFGLDDEERMKTQGYFIEVDANDEFWRQFKVKVHGPGDFTSVGLRSAAVQLEYGSPTDPKARLVTESYRFTAPTAEAAKDTKEQEFSKPMYRGHRDYRASITYAFDPLSGWQGDPKEQTTSKKSSDVRDTYVVPERDFTFLIIHAGFADAPDWSQLSHIVLELRYPSVLSKDAPTQTESYSHTVNITPRWTPTLEMTAPVQGSPPPPLPWKLRLKDPDAPKKVSYQLTYFLKSGQKQQGPVLESQRTQLVLESPFRSRKVTVKPMRVSWDQVDAVEVTFRDKTTGKRPAVDDLFFDPPATQGERAPEQSVQLSLDGDSVHEWRATYYMKEGEERVTDWAEATPAVVLPRLPSP
ncbi:MAG: hypothetical protein ABW123_27965 [Cystobacter sp.]